MTDVPADVAVLHPMEPRVHCSPSPFPRMRCLRARVFTRASPEDTRYELRDASMAGRAEAPPPFTASADVRISGVPLTLRVPVMRREADLPFGYELYPLEILPAVKRLTAPAVRILVRGSGGAIRSRRASPITRRSANRYVRAQRCPPAGRRLPRRGHSRLQRLAQATRRCSRCGCLPLAAEAQAVSAAVTVGGRVYTSDIEAIRHRDLPVQDAYREARTVVRGVDVSVVPD